MTQSDSAADAASPDSSTPANQEVQVEVTEEGPVIRSMRVEVDARRVSKAFTRAYKDLARQASVKGFRPGKVPQFVLERMYGATVPSEIERMLVSDTFQDAVEQAGLLPLVEPEIDAGAPVSGEPFSYTARIEVRPEIELPDLAGLAAIRPAVDVKDEDVDAQIEQLRERAAREVEEPEGTQAATGHILKVNFEGRINGELFEGGSAEDIPLEIGSGQFIPGFEEQLVGAVSGEDRDVTVDFPEDYGSEDLQGKQAVFAVRVVAVQKREKPEVDDEFAKDMGDFETLDAFRDRIRADIQQEREQAANGMLKRTVMDSLIERTEFEVGPGVIDRQLQNQLASLQRRFEGQMPPDVLQAQLARAQEDGREAAERSVRERLLLQEIVKAEGLEVAAEDIDGRLGQMAESQGMEVAQLREMSRDQGWNEALEAELLEEKALDFLAAGATVAESSDPAS
jgi:trigger factor